MPLADAGPAHPLMEELAGRLFERVPASPPPTVLHNDFKLDNCQFSPTDPDRVVSVFDWDMATVGDPLVDLGTLLNYLPDPAGDSLSERDLERVDRVGGQAPEHREGQRNMQHSQKRTCLTAAPAFRPFVRRRAQRWATRASHCEPPV